MTREEAKNLFRNDKDSYGKPKSIMKKIDQIYDEFDNKIAFLKAALRKHEDEAFFKTEQGLNEFNNENTDFRDNDMESQQEYFGKK